jgi:hypothetical protein
MPGFRSLKASFSVQDISLLKKVGARTHLCLAPLLIEKLEDVELLQMTLACIPL